MKKNIRVCKIAIFSIFIDSVMDPCCFLLNELFGIFVYLTKKDVLYKYVRVLKAFIKITFVVPVDLTGGKVILWYFVFLSYLGFMRITQVTIIDEILTWTS